MVAHGRGDSVGRLGWEMNESTMPWRGSDPGHVHRLLPARPSQTIRATNSTVLLDLSINAHGPPAGLCGDRSTNCYPGEAYVDATGIDDYDHFPWSPPRPP